MASSSGLDTIQSGHGTRSCAFRHMPDPHNHGIWTHGHVFLGHGHDRSETRAKLAALVTARLHGGGDRRGLCLHSMALLADGVHMATHVGALGLAAGAYWLARRHAGQRALQLSARASSAIWRPSPAPSCWA